MNNLSGKLRKILEVLKEISNENLVSYQRQSSQTKDLELISLALTAEFIEVIVKTIFFDISLLQLGKNR